MDAMRLVRIFSAPFRRSGKNLGQDLIEYALLAGFVAVSAGAMIPNVAISISTVFSKVGSVIGGSASQQSQQETG
jgi:pilus assembly protein Flp/PilA